MLTAKQLGYRIQSFDIGYSSGWWATFVIWHLLAGALFIRRVSGVFVHPLSGWAMLGVVSLILIITSLFRISVGRLGSTIVGGGSNGQRLSFASNPMGPIQSAPGRSQFSQRLVTVLLTISGLMILGSISIAGSSLFIVLVTWGLWAASETAWLLRTFAKRPGAPRRAAAESTNVTSVSEATNSLASTGPSETESNQVLDGEDGSLPAGVTQQLIRSQHGQVESLHGLVRVDFPVGERTQFTHIAFCPPFQHLPEVHVGQVSGPTVSTKLTQVESFGMRIEVRRNREEREQLSVVLEIEATAAEG